MPAVRPTIAASACRRRTLMTARAVALGLALDLFALVAHASPGLETARIESPADVVPGAASVEVANLRAQARAHELGDGVPKNPALAVARLCEAARLGDAASQFDLGWIYANGHGVPRDDAQAAFFLRLAIEQGIGPAGNLLRLIGQPASPAAAPRCMRGPDPVELPMVAAAPPVPLVPPKTIAALVGKIAPKFRVPSSLVIAIMKAESNFDAAALSPKNARGLMQLIPATASRFQVTNVFDPAQNIRGGVAYLRWLLAYFEGDVALVAAAYNAGEGTVERYRGVPPYAETRAYVKRILATVGPVVETFDTSAVAPSPYLTEIRQSQRLR
jgi:hypothetical protein